ncbi:MAG: ribose 1,5-bisphosphate isomerase [Candidatus Altiarchaeota archaeon]
MGSVDETARKISSMEVRGALDIAIAALKALETVVDGGGRLKELEAAGEKLKKARPTAVSLPNAVNYVIYLAKKHEPDDGKAFKSAMTREIHDFIIRQENSLEKIAEIGSKLIEEGDVLMTHCNSDTVAHIFKRAWRDGKKFRVIATETRPRYQGYITSRDLASAGIPVTLIVDSAVYHTIKKLDVDKVFVGADTVYANGDVVNKIGTMQVALCAKSEGKDFIVATESIKFSPESIMGGVSVIEERDPKEVAEIEGVRVFNPAFDVTPKEYVNMIITEYGIIPPEAAYSLLKERFGWSLTGE